MRVQRVAVVVKFGRLGPVQKAFGKMKQFQQKIKNNTKRISQEIKIKNYFLTTFKRSVKEK